MTGQHVLPRFDDRWSYLYLEQGRLEREAASLSFYGKEGVAQIPINQIGLLLLGPGTSVTQAAMKALMDNRSLVCWTGDGGARLYAHGAGGARSSRRLLRQAQLVLQRGFPHSGHPPNVSEALPRAASGGNHPRTNPGHGRRARPREISGYVPGLWRPMGSSPRTIRNTGIPPTRSTARSPPPTRSSTASAMRQFSRRDIRRPSALSTPAKCSVSSTTSPTCTKRRPRCRPPSKPRSGPEKSRGASESFAERYSTKSASMNAACPT